MKIIMKMAFLIFVTALLSVESFADGDGITFTPIEHATMVIQTKDVTIYIDPVGDAKLFKGFPKPDIVMITDIHHDHLNPEVLSSLKKESTIIIGPQAVVSELKYGVVINNGETKKIGTIKVEAIPMYNTTEERLNFHPKGRGNGYVITLNKKRVYISGDTEDIKEMRSLKDIDYAFVCMNLPYTMTVDQAVSAVLEFKPKVVYPYHYRGKGMFSDITRFQHMVSSNKGIKVRLLDWYKK